MAIQHANRGIVKKDLQLYYNREFVKSFRGEATTNIVSNTTDFSGLSYAGYSTEWTSDPTRFTKSYNAALQTPIGTGATLLTESGTAGYHHLSRFGGAETGGHSISCYVYPVNGSITNFAIGMLGDGGSTAIFNLVTGTVVSTGARVSNAFITKVSGWLGWYRVGANIGGRSGGWVGAVGLDVQTSYTPSLPYKSMYVTGMQYESKTYCTPFVVGSNRSANTIAGGGGLLDISGNNVNADLTNVSFDSTGYIFTGSSSNRIQFTTPTSFIYSAAGKTVLMWIKYGTSSYVGFCGLGNAANGQSFNLRSAAAATAQFLGFMGYNADYDPSAGPQINNNVWHLIGATFDAYGAGNLKLYVDGVNIASTTSTLNTAPEASNIGYIGRSSHTGAEGYFTGQAGQFMMYNRALSADEVSQIFNSQRKTYGV
jgi:hypothetical protein